MVKTIVLLTSALIVSSFPAFGQQGANEKYRSIVRYRLAAGKQGDFIAATRDWNAMVKKAGSQRYFTAWQSLTGPREFVMVSYVPNFAVFDVPQDPALKDVAGQAASIFARIGQCVESVERIMDEVQPDLSLPRAASAPAMIRSLRVVVKPERVADYVAAVKAEIAPAYKKAGVKVWVTARTRFGGPTSEFRSASGIDNWAALDGEAPVIKAMGRAAYDAYLAKMRSMIVESEVNIYRYRADLSYLSPSASSPSGN